MVQTLADPVLLKGAGGVPTQDKWGVGGGPTIPPHSNALIIKKKGGTNPWNPPPGSTTETVYC